METQIPIASFQNYDDVLEPSPMRRDTFELRISDSHVKFGMPDYNLWWIDTSIDRLGWNKAVVQLGHHSYNPTKCDDDQCGPLGPNTWHWDNFGISNADPFKVTPGSRRFANSVNNQITFGDAAEDSSFLRFAGIGDVLEVSFDGGTTWALAEMQAQRADFIADEHFKSFWMPAPQGADQVEFRGTDWFGGEWHVRDVSLWSIDSTADCDFDSNGQCNVDDLNAMLASGPIAPGIVVDSSNQQFDLNADHIIDLMDRDSWLATAATENQLNSPYLLGDFDLNGTVDGLDFYIWSNHKFQLSTNWSDGDVNGDGTVDGYDFLIWNRNKFQNSTSAIPEPLACPLFLCLLPAVMRPRWGVNLTKQR